MISKNQESECRNIIYSIEIDEDLTSTSNIKKEINAVEDELDILSETIDSITKLKPDCDKLDYALAASSGIICGVLDIFLVSKPGKSALGNLSDVWFEQRIQDFARLNGWSSESNSSKSAIRFLEQRFKIQYDQTGLGDIGANIYGLNAKNHHFKSLGHNPSILGLFFSIMDQFSNTSHFVTEGELASLSVANRLFKLQGNTVPNKVFCGFINWFGHLVSDVGGSSGSVGRGMGIPSPLWTWCNDIIAIKRSLKIPVLQFDRDLNELALQVYQQGFDLRFQAAQAIPVLLNEVIVRFFYASRRLLQYYKLTPQEEQNFSLLWKTCEPFKNPTVKRMLTVAHGTFCVVDLADATLHGFIDAPGAFNPTAFLLRVNVVGVGRFTISLYGEVKREVQYKKQINKNDDMRRNSIVLRNYLQGLIQLDEMYGEKSRFLMVQEIKENEMYQAYFSRTIDLAVARGVTKDKILTTKNAIDEYFMKGE